MRDPETTDTIYTLFMNEMKSRAYRAESFDAWLISWHLSVETGFPTRQINYHLGKLAKQGRLFRESNGYFTRFSPVEFEGYRRRGDKFVAIPQYTA